MTQQEARSGPLAGLRIADFTWIGAGSYTTKMLADAGAEVLKIESSTRPDSLRNAAPFAGKVPGVNRSGYFADRNSSKKSITLNLKDPRGLALAKEIIARSDIVANNFAAGTMEKLGLGYETVRQIRPDVIYLDMSMQGSSGPEHKYIGYGLTINALTGLQHLCGLPERLPIGTGTNYPDHVPNPTHAAFAVLAAVRHRRRHGEGQYIDMAQTEPTMALLGPAFLQFSINGDVANRRGNHHLGRAPHGVYPCAGDDKWIAIAAVDDRQWQGLAAILGGQFDPSWNDAATRWEQRAAVDAAIAACSRTWDARLLMEALQEQGVAAGVVQNPGDMVRDPQLAHRGHWRRLDHPEMGNSLYNAPPYRFSRSPNELRSAAPLLGQHTVEICQDLLGLTAAQIEALSLDGVLK
jgi:benzylsuccinate CoA-transferase BbsF subunit